MKAYNKGKQGLQNRLDNIYFLYKRHNYDEALNEINDYLKVVPNSVNMLSMKAAIYRHYKDFDMAESILSSIPSHNKDSFMELARLYTCTQRYDEALELLELLNTYTLTDKDTEQVKKLDMVILKHKYPAKFFVKYGSSVNSELEYFEKQMISYSAKRAISYMVSLQTNREENENEYSSKFNKDFDIEKEFIEIRKQLHKIDKNMGTLFDEYYVYYPNCGTRVDDNCNYVKVYAIKDTHNIMKMLPMKSNRVYKQSKVEEIDYSLYPVYKKDMVKRFNDRLKKKLTQD